MRAFIFRYTKFFPLFAPLAALFLWVNFVSTQDGGHNAMARMVTLHAFVEKGNFQIDEYLPFTVDWAQSKSNGHYYQNKAPGPVFVAIPFYYVLHKLAHAWAKRSDPGAKAPIPTYFHKTLLSFFLQVIPFLFLSFWVYRHLQNQTKITQEGELFFLLSLWFGSTAAILMNSYFGHGLAALLLLASVYFLEKEKYIFAAASFSLAALSDYGICILSPLFLFFALDRKDCSKQKIFLSFCLGAFPFALLWVFYHTFAFGGPLALPMSQISPVFVESSSQWNAWGVIGLLPSFTVVKELLWGSERGLLLTQPWILFLALISCVTFFRQDQSQKRILFFTMGSFLLLFYLNASFEGWHGGGAPGPRYMSAIFPLFSWLAWSLWPLFHKGQKLILTLGLIYTLLFRLFLATGSILIDPEKPLWPYLWEGLRDLRRGSEHYKLLAISIACVMVLFSIRYAYKVLQEKNFFKEANS